MPRLRRPGVRLAIARVNGDGVDDDARAPSSITYARRTWVGSGHTAYRADTDLSTIFGIAGIQTGAPGVSWCKGTDEGAVMTKQETETRAAVASVTLAAAHRRDHQHPGGEACAPHRVQVVHLGGSAAMVCHDCCTDSGFVTAREAELLATRHTRDTAPAATGSAA